MRVMVIFSNQEYSSSFDPFPPVGTKGTIVEGLDKYDEYEIVFDDYPPTTLRDPAWSAHKSMIVFIDDKNETECKEQLFVVN
jgi:hypothetical protein